MVKNYEEEKDMDELVCPPAPVLKYSFTIK